jgi:hypothetical protein
MRASWAEAIGDPATVPETSMTVLSSRMAIHGRPLPTTPSTDTRVAASPIDSEPMAPFPLKFDDELRGDAHLGMIGE